MGKIACPLMLVLCISQQGCGEEADDTSQSAAHLAEAGVSLTDGGTGTVVSFSRDILPIITGSCAVAGCHMGPSPRARMNLEAAQAYASLVGQFSGQCQALKRVDPGRPEKSYLMNRLEARAPGVDCPQKPVVTSMPPKGMLEASAISKVRDWIQAGAPNN